MRAKTVSRVGRDLTEGSIPKLLVSFAIPMILANMIQQLYSVVDLVVIGQYVGSTGTVGVSTGGEVSDLLTPVATSLATGAQIYIAQLVGAKEEKRMKEAVGTMLTTMMLFSALFILVPVIFHAQILSALNCPDEAYLGARDYLIITSCGMPFIFGYNAICAILRAMGESKQPLVFVTVAATANIFLDVLFVAVFKMEAAGTAIATVGSQLGSFAAAFLYMYRHREQFDFELKLSYFKIEWKHLNIMLKLGIPQMIRSIFVRFSMIWVKAGINSFGLVASATYSIGNKLERLVDVFFNGFTQAGSAMVGQNIGAKKHDRVKKVIYYVLLFSASLGAVGSVLFMKIPRPLFSLFTKDAEVIEAGVAYLMIMAVGCFIHSLASSFKCMANGVGAVGLAYAIGILDGVSRIIVCLVTVNVFSMGLYGYFWGAALCHLLPGLVSFGYFISGKWKTRKLLVEQ